MSDSQKNLTRRGFLTRGAGLAAIGATPIALQRARAAADDKNPFEYNIDHLRKVDPKLIHYEQVGGFKTPLAEPRRLALGPDDKVYVSGKDRVEVFEPSGAKLRELAVKGTALAVTVARNGRLFLGVKDHVEIFAANGQSQAVWAAPGPKTWFTGIAVAENDVFAADAGNRVVLRYDHNGKVIGRLGEKNPARNIQGLMLPSPFCDVELAPDGLLRVTNTGNHLIETYTFDGELKSAWGKPSAGIEGFCGCCNPINIALLSDGRVVTCEKGLPRVKVYRPQGDFESVVLGPESFPENAGHRLTDGTMAGLDAAVDSQNRIFVLDQVRGEVKIMARKKTAA